jgi:hypothetical protein
MQIRWSTPAAEDLERICERIARDSPQAARRIAKTIMKDAGPWAIFRIKDALAFVSRDAGNWFSRPYHISLYHISLCIK